MARAVGILVILAGFASAASAVFPKESGMAELLHDAREGRLSSVHIIYLSPMEAQARWGDGIMQSKEYTYQFSALPEGRDSAEALRRILQERLEGDGAGPAFDGRDPLAGLGGLSLMVPVLYWRFIEAEWLKWAVLAVFAAGVGAMITRKAGRAPETGYWLVAACTGFGMPAYFWTEPRPLWRFRGSGGRIPKVAGSDVSLRTICWLGITLLMVIVAMPLR